VSVGRDPRSEYVNKHALESFGSCKRAYKQSRYLVEDIDDLPGLGSARLLAVVCRHGSVCDVVLYSGNGYRS
jgi:hypothetical protein